MTPSQPASARMVPHGDQLTEAMPRPSVSGINLKMMSPFMA